jgi:hypothetical protein
MYTTVIMTEVCDDAPRSSFGGKDRVAPHTHQRYHRTMNYADVRAQLSRTPAVISSLLADASSGLWQANEGPGTWSPFEVLCHLIHGEDDDWIPRIRAIVDEGGRKPFTPFDREGGTKKYGSEPAVRLLTLFADARRSSLETLDNWRLSESMMAFTGIHPEFGRVTLGQLLACWATHDLAHIVQISRTLERHFGASIGPWRAYFSVLRDTTV